MGNWGTCKKCGHIGWMTNHQCPPTWDCIPADALDYADEHDTWLTVYADDAKDAAQEFADYTDRWSADYESEREVIVRHADGTLEKYLVQMDYLPVYTAELIQAIERRTSCQC